MRHIKSAFLTLLCLLACLPARVRAQSEFDAGGYDFMRVENEIKLVVPIAIQDQVWEYLQERYSPESPFLPSIDSTFKADFAIDLFMDQYFDTPGFELVQLSSGVRHRRRKVLTDPTSRKDGRELIQIKINGIGENVLNRGEYKYPVYKPEPGDEAKQYDDHPFLGRVSPKHRSAVISRLAELKVDAASMAPTIEIKQMRKRVYILMGDQPFATLTLDIDTAYYEGESHPFTELEMELNEIAYTQSDSARREEMEAINAVFRKDLLTKFPEIKQDQTPKYNKAAAAFGIDPANGKYGKKSGSGMGPWLFGGIGLGVFAVLFLLYRKRKQRQEAERSAYLGQSGGAS